MPFSLPDLPYDYAALEPYIDGTTMNVRIPGGAAAPLLPPGVAGVRPGRLCQSTLAQ